MDISLYGLELVTLLFFILQIGLVGMYIASYHSSDNNFQLSNRTQPSGLEFVGLRFYIPYILYSNSKKCPINYYMDILYKIFY